MAKLTNPNIDKSPIRFDFRYLNLVSKGDFSYVAKKDKLCFKDLQTFLYETSLNYSSLEEVITVYTSKKGSKVKAKESKYVREIFKQLEANKNKKDILLNNFLESNRGVKNQDLTHIHLHPNGNGKAVILGINYEKTFYVFAIDAQHDFNKKS
ncbi:hypothetical protein B7939_00925 [Eggerthia catenaformis]|nr:hypothetical protein B7939_00925 [Eggerthia catenaformis]